MTGKTVPPPMPTGISSDVIILTRAELATYRTAVYQAGVNRGRIEERADRRNSEAHGEAIGRTPSLSGHSQQGRGGAGTDDQAAPVSTETSVNCESDFDSDISKREKG